MGPLLPQLLACSGPGAHRAIAAADAYGYWAALGVGLLLLPTVTRYVFHRQLLTAALHTLLLALHPAWWVSASIGDCGSTRETLSTTFLLTGFGLWLSSGLISS